MVSREGLFLLKTTYMKEQDSEAITKLSNITKWQEITLLITWYWIPLTNGHWHRALVFSVVSVMCQNLRGIEDILKYMGKPYLCRNLTTHKPPILLIIHEMKCTRHWASIHQAARSLTAKSREVSELRDWMVWWSYLSQIWQSSRQQRCRGACQISEWLQSLNPNLTASRLHEILWQDVCALSEKRHWSTTPEILHKLLALATRSNLEIHKLNNSKYTPAVFSRTRYLDKRIFYNVSISQPQCLWKQ